MSDLLLHDPGMQRGRYFSEKGGKLIGWIDRQSKLSILALEPQKDGA